VAKHGPSFETILLEAEANNPKFGFLKHGDIYRPYYEKKISEYAAEEGGDFARPPAADSGSQVLFEQPAQIQAVAPRRPVRQPPPDQYSVNHPYIAMPDR